MIVQPPTPRPAWRPTALVRASIALHAAAGAVTALRPEWWPWTLGSVALDHLALTSAGLWPRSKLLGPNWTRLPEAARRRREVAITIDDGPDPDVTPRVLDLLAERGARATFFCIGERAARHPDVCREIVRHGHSIENHSQHHRHHFSLLGPAGFARELQAAQDTLTEITGIRPRFFRAPAGLRNPFLDPVLHRLDLTLASWTRRGFDTRIGDPERVLAALTNKLSAGDILLLHDAHAARTPAGQPVILAVLPRLLDEIAACQLTTVTLSSCSR